MMFDDSAAGLPWHHLHPILVNFTAALVPASVGSDLFGKLTKKQSFGATAFWTLFYAMLITPLTVAAGWSWKARFPAEALPEDLIFTHQWLGSLLVVLFAGLTLWRGNLYFKDREPGFFYFLIAAATVAALVYQGNLGGQLVFGP